MVEKKNHHSVFSMLYYLFLVMILLMTSCIQMKNSHNNSPIRNESEIESGENLSGAFDYQESENAGWHLKETMENNAPGDIPVAVSSAENEIDVLYYCIDEARLPCFSVYQIKPNFSNNVLTLKDIRSDVNAVSFAAGNGLFWLLTETAGSAEDESESILYCFENDGKIHREIKLEKHVVGLLYASSDDCVWIRDRISETFYLYSTEGEWVQSLKSPDDMGLIFEGNNNRLYGLFSQRHGDGTDIYMLQENGFERISEWKYEMPEMIFPGIHGLFLYMSNDGLYEYFNENEYNQRLFSFSECGISTSKVFGVMIGNGGEFLVLSEGSEPNMISLSIIEKETESSLGNYLTLAVLEFTDQMNELVTLYNRAGRPYTIRVEEYSSQIGETTDAEDALIRLQTDMISGGSIDIIDLSGIEDSNVRRRYADLGLLEDLYPWMEADPDFRIEDYQMQVWKANELEGHVYNLVPFYGIDTVFGRISLYGNKWQIVPEEVFGSEEPLMVYGQNCTSSDILCAYCQYVLDGSPEEILNQINNSERIQMLFRFALAYPDEPIGGESIIDMHEGRQRMEAVGNRSTSGIDRSMERYMACQALMGEQVTFIGYPVDYGIGSSFYNIVSVAMSSSSGNKEGVWDFFRFILDESVQMNTQDLMHIRRALPVNLAAWEDSCQKAMALEQGNGAGIFREDQEWYVIFPVIKQEEVDQINSLISQISRVREYDMVIYKLMEEEWNHYRNGAASLEACVDNLQSRAENYLYEIR